MTEEGGSDMTQRRILGLSTSIPAVLVFSVLPVFAQARATARAGRAPKPEARLLFDAVREKSAAKVRELLQAGVDHRSPDAEGMTPLMLALNLSQAEIARLLFDKGPDLGAKNKSGWTALSYALFRKQTEIALLLIEAGSDPNQVDGAGWTPLMMAIRYDTPETAKSLLAKGASHLPRNKDGWTPLMIALRNNMPEIARTLIELGSDPAAHDKDGWTPLMQALANDQPDNARLLVERGADIEARTSLGWTPLMQALRSGLSDCAALLLDRGAKLDAANNDGWTPLMFAARYGQPELARRMLEAGASPAPLNSGGWSALMLSLSFSTPETTLLLLDKGSDILVKDKDGNSPLLLAAEAGDARALGLILDKGASLAEKDGQGRAALHRAAEKGRTEAVALCLERKAKIEEPRKDGLTPLLCALRGGHAETARLLLARKARKDAKTKEGGALHEAARGGSRDAVELILAAKLPVNGKDEAGLTPLHYAGSRAAAEALLAKGGDLRAVTSGGMGVLHAAASNGHKDAVELFIEKGLNPLAGAKIGGFENVTPLFMAVTNKHVETALFLLDLGADWRIETGYHMSPYSMALAKGLTDVVEKILGKGQDLNQRDALGRSAAHNVETPEMLEWVKARGADVKARDERGTTALHLAAARGLIPLVERLLAEGLDVQQATQDGETALHWAERDKMAELLVAKGASLHAKDHFGMTPLERSRYAGRSNEYVGWLKLAEKKQDEAVLKEKLAEAAFVLKEDPNRTLAETTFESATYASYYGALAFLASPSIAGNEGMAVGLLTSAVNGGMPEACYRLGQLIAQGRAPNTGLDPEKLSRAAAEGGLALAQYEMAVNQLASANDPKTYAFDPLRTRPVRTMGQFYEDAFIWLSLAAIQGHAQASKVLHNYAQQLPAGDKDTERRLAERNGWRSSFRCTPPGGAETDIKVVRIQFFETPVDLLPADKRQYRVGFAKSGARYISWEMHLQAAGPVGKLDLPVTAAWYNRKGERVLVHQQTISFGDGETVAVGTRGGGFDEPGRWAEGPYRVDFFVGPLKVARCGYEIY